MRVVNRSKRFRWTGLMLGTLFSAMPAIAGANVLEKIPADAALVVEIKNAQEVSGKLAALCKKWGLDQMVPPLSDPLGALLEQAKFSAGVDKNADAAMALLGFDSTNGNPPPMLLYIPVTDYAAFIGNFKDARKDGNVDVFHMPTDNNGGLDVFATHWGSYAVITPHKALLANEPAGLKVDGSTEKEFATKDAVAFLNLKVMGPKWLDMLKQEEPKITDEVNKTLTTNVNFNQKFVPAVNATLKQGLGLAEEFLSDAQSVVVSVNLSDDGVATTLLVQANPDSNMGKFFTGMKNTDASLLAGLPTGKYLFFAGSVGATEESIKMAMSQLDPIIAELNNAGDQGKPITDYLAAVRKMVESTKGTAIGMVAPTGMLGAVPMIQMLAVYTGNAAELMATQKAAAESEQQLMNLVQSLSGAGAPKTEIKFTENAKELDGVKFNQLATTFSGDQNSPQAAQVKQMMAFMYGPNGANAFVGTVDDQHVLTAMGVDDATTSAAIKAIKANQDSISGDATLAVVNKNLPKNRMSVFYLPVETIITTVANIAKTMGMPIPLDIKPNLPPIGATVGSDGAAIRIDEFIPSDLVQELISMGLKLQMMKNGKPGQPGGL